MLFERILAYFLVEAIHDEHINGGTFFIFFRAHVANHLFSLNWRAEQTQLFVSSAYYDIARAFAATKSACAHREGSKCRSRGHSTIAVKSAHLPQNEKKPARGGLSRWV